MTTPIVQLNDRLKDAGHSATEPRVRIFAALQATDALTMRQLINTCPDIDRSTIYRTVELFEKLDIAHRIQLGWKYQIELTDRFVHHHHHFTCSGCGAVSALAEDEQLEARLVALALDADFESRGHQVEIHGLCSHCRKN